MNSIYSYIYTLDILVSAKRSSKTVLSTETCSSSDHIPVRVPIAPSDIWAEFGPTGSQPDILPGMSHYYNSIKNIDIIFISILQKIPNALVKKISV